MKAWSKFALLAVVLISATVLLGANTQQASGCNPPEITVDTPSNGVKIPNAPVSLKFSAKQGVWDMSPIDPVSHRVQLLDNLNNLIDVTQFIATNCDLLKKNCTYAGDVSIPDGSYTLTIKVCNQAAACSTKEVIFDLGNGQILPGLSDWWSDFIEDTQQRVDNLVEIWQKAASGCYYRLTFPGWLLKDCDRTIDPDCDNVRDSYVQRKEIKDATGTVIRIDEKLYKCDNCPLVPNANQHDFNSDGIGDACQDSDNDGLLDSVEIDGYYNSAAGQVIKTDPLNPDTDGDGLTDGQEQLLGTNPLDSDTDHDGLLDGDEITFGTNPLTDDTDGDCACQYANQSMCHDYEELGGPPATKYNKLPIGFVPHDRDGDGKNDAIESNCRDADGDGLFDWDDPDDTGGDTANPPDIKHPLWKFSGDVQFNEKESPVLNASTISNYQTNINYPFFSYVLFHRQTSENKIVFEDLDVAENGSGVASGGCMNTGSGICEYPAIDYDTGTHYSCIYNPIPLYCNVDGTTYPMRTYIEYDPQNSSNVSVSSGFEYHSGIFTDCYIPELNPDYRGALACGIDIGHYALCATTTQCDSSVPSGYNKTSGPFDTTAATDTKYLIMDSTNIINDTSFSTVGNFHQDYSSGPNRSHTSDYAIKLQASPVNVSIVIPAEGKKLLYGDVAGKGLEISLAAYDPEYNNQAFHDMIVAKTEWNIIPLNRCGLGTSGGTTMKCSKGTDGGNPCDHYCMGMLPKAVFDELPSDNKYFGNNKVELYFNAEWLYIGRVKLDEKNVKVFFPKQEKTHPVVALKDAPNWFVYWPLVTAIKALALPQIQYQELIEDVSTGRFVAGFYPRGVSYFLVSKLAAEHYVMLTETTESIDTFGAVSVHEKCHMDYWLKTWGAGEAEYNARKAAEDKDGDFLKDSDEASGAVKGIGDAELNPNYKNTNWGAESWMNDFEDYCIAMQQEGWGITQADDDDWSYPGKQWQ